FFHFWVFLVCLVYELLAEGLFFFLRTKRATEFCPLTGVSEMFIRDIIYFVKITHSERNIMGLNTARHDVNMLSA
ncbi:hypothetical protein C4813_24370, partial [Salmonella enterica subsp. enterica serovar Rubislaw]